MGFAKMEQPKFKILSIDGGGIRGVIPCQFLAELENDLICQYGDETRLCDYFDLIAGTSTGGIIAIGLALGIKAQTILDLYVKHGSEIFPTSRQSYLSKFIRTIRGRSFYDRNPLRNLLSQIYNSNGLDTRLGDARTRLLIPTYNLESHTIHVLKTSHSEKLQRDYQIPTVDAALSTAAAPAYFTPHDFSYDNKGKDGSVHFRKMVDGGIVANNPAFMALLEATHCLNKNLEDIALLSLGTGFTLNSFRRESEKISPFYWVNPIKGPRIYEIMAEAQSAHVDNLLNLYKNNVARESEDKFIYFRLQHQFSEKDKLDLDSTSSSTVSRMLQAGQEIYRIHGCDIKSIFTTKTKDEFKPHHTFS